MKKLLALLLSLAMVFSLAACGGGDDKESSGGKDSGKETVQPSGAGKTDTGGKKDDAQLGVGVYEGYAFDMFDELMPIAEAYGGENRLELKDGGKASLTLESDTVECEWELSGESLTVTIRDGEACEGTLKDGVVTLDFMGIMDIIFAMDGAEVPELPVPGAFPAAFAELHGGDWHGMAEIYDSTGDLADNAGNQMEIIARFAFNEDGTCTPFIAAALSGDSESNFSDLSVTYNEYGDLMLLEGELVNRPITDSSNIYVWDGVLKMDIYVDDGEGDTLNLIANLRRLDEAWDYDYDDPALPEAAVEFYMGKSMEEITELFGLDPSQLPEPSAGGGTGGGESGGTGGGTPTENPGFSGPTAEFDYGGKGMILFDYPSDIYTYEKKFGVESLTANDGSLKISFVADWGMDDYAESMTGYETYASESGGVIQEGLSYGGFEATRCTWENVIGDISFETYILFGEGYGDYVGVNVIATAGSQSALDANMDVIEAVLHSVRLK